MKYFEDNRYIGKELIDLHLELAHGSAVVLSNLFFHEANDIADTHEHRLKLAKSAYNVIAVCEAIIDRVPEGERIEALDEVREKVAPVDCGEMIERLFKILLK